MTLDFTDYKLLSFDIYGTLIDWEDTVYKHILSVISRPVIAATLTSSSSTTTTTTAPAVTDDQIRQRILDDFQKHEHDIQLASPDLLYTDVLSRTLTAIGTHYAVPIPPTTATHFAASISSWPAFPDTIAAMQTLAKHYKLIALSNIDNPSFGQTLAGSLRGVAFDAVYTAQDIGSYKPDARNFAYLTEHARADFGVAKAQILHTAHSLLHDHVPAKAFGLRPSVWIERGEDPARCERLQAEDRILLGARYATLGEMAADVERAFEAKGRSGSA